MKSSLLPWIKLAGVWATAVVLCLTALVFLIWQTSGPMGRRGQIASQVEELQTEIERLEKTVALAFEERVVVAETGVEIDRIAGEIFGQIDERLTSVLRDVGVIARGAGLIPEGFSYSVRREATSGGVRFGIAFSVAGTYEQVRQLLAGLQASSQFLIIDRISFKGEEDPRSQKLGIGLQVSTYLADAEPEELRALINMLEVDEVDLGGDLEVEAPVQETEQEISSASEDPADDDGVLQEMNADDATAEEPGPAVAETEEAP